MLLNPLYRTQTMKMQSGIPVRPYTPSSIRVFGYRHSILAMVALCVMFLQGTPARASEVLHRFFSQSFAESAAYPAPVLIEGTIRTDSRLSVHEIEAKLAELHGLPDHPDRGELEYLAALSAAPTEMRFTVATDGSGVWFYKEQQQGERGTLHAGGGGKDRWMFFEPSTTDESSSEGQLTVIRSGVPFPSFYNVGRFRELAEKRIRTVLHGNPYSIGGEISSIERRPGEEAYTAAVLLPSREWSATAVASLASDRPMLRTVEFRSSASHDARILCRVMNSGHFEISDDGGLLPLIPARVTVDQHSTREIYNIQHFRVLAPSELQALAAVPDASKGVQVMDFREPDSARWNDYPNVVTLRWTAEEGTDTYQYVGATGSSKTWGKLRWMALCLFGLGVMVIAFLLRAKLKSHQTHLESRDT